MTTTSSPAEGIVFVEIAPDLSEFERAMKRVVYAALGVTCVGDRYYRTQDGVLHRRADMPALIHNGKKARR